MQKGLNKQDRIKQAIKNVFLKEDNLSFLPESYLEAFCKHLQLNIDECDWFGKCSDTHNADVTTQSTLINSLLVRDEMAKKVVDSGYARDICCFERIREELGFEVLEKLFSAFYRIYILDLQSNIGMYGNYSIFISLPKYSRKRVAILLRIKNSKFVYEIYASLCFLQETCGYE